MFERFTMPARAVVVLTQEEARRLRHDYVGTEHLLLGLLREEEGVAARVLVSFAVTLERVRGEVENMVGIGYEDPGDKVPFTPRSKTVLEMALQEAMQLEHDYIGTEHLLLGLVRERSGVASQILSKLRVHPDDVRRQVIGRLAREEGIDPDVAARLEASPEETGWAESALDPTRYRGRIRALRVTVNVNSDPQTLMVDLDYAYAVQDGEDASGMLNHDDIITGVVGILKARELGTVETIVSTVGEYVLSEFPAVGDVTVSITVDRMLEAYGVSGFEVVRVFRR